ncbi:MOSC N-terminal beta barrel domain-containing protein [Streptomyces sp. NPDC051322]|uniref:MOSC domain-containing protein n=1 Tax=Streptomyces sp. NPDC051322 TaxID=3154645 RepID=UPI00344D8264
MPEPGRAVLQSIHVYPVKSLAGQAPDSVVVEPWGPAGDRRWMLVDAAGTAVTQRQQPRLALAGAEPLSDGGIRLSAPGCEPLTVRVPGPAAAIGVRLFGDKIEVVPAHACAHTWFSTYLGTEVRLVHLDDPARRRTIDPRYARPGETVSLADGYPLLVTTAASLDALNSLIAQGDLPDEGPLPMDRFRPSLVVAGVPPWAEDDWLRIAVGDIPFRVVKPCGRCVVTTTDQHTAERGKEPLRTLARHRRVDSDLLFGQNLIPELTGVIRVGDPVHILE